MSLSGGASGPLGTREPRRACLSAPPPPPRRRGAGLAACRDQLSGAPQGGLHICCPCGPRIVTTGSDIWLWRCSWQQGPGSGPSPRRRGHQRLTRPSGPPSSLRNAGQLCGAAPHGRSGSPCRLLAAVSRLRHVLLLPAEPEARSEPAAVLGGVSGTELTQRSAVLLHTDQERQGEQPYLLRASVGGADGLMLRGAGAGGGQQELQ